MRLGAMGARGGFGSAGVLGGAVNYNAASLAFFAAFTTPPSAARKTLINNCVVALINAGIWSQLDILYMLAAADSQAATINWKNPGTFNLVAVNSPTFSADRGFTSDGSTSRLRTQFTPSTNGVNFTQNSASAWVYCRTDVAENVNDIGNTSNPATKIATRLVGNNAAASVNDITPTNVANASSIGFFGSSRINSTTKRLWKNGVQIGTDQAVSSTAYTNTEQWMLGCNGGTPQFSTKQQSCGAWGANLTGLESAFYTAILTYLQGVGAA
jgi:hypothetical protein